MSLIERWSKKKICDITIQEDKIDVEYTQRIMSLNSREQLKDLIEDYEEFLPTGLNEFRSCSMDTFKELMFQINRYRERARLGQPLPAEPTEAVMFITAPMLRMPRGISRTLSVEMKRHITWGFTFLKMKQEGFIDKLLVNQEKMYKKIIELKKEVEETFDTKSPLTEQDLANYGSKR